MVIVAGLLWLIWRAINGLVVMADRVRRGWTMMVRGEEAPAPISPASPEPAKA
jgi:hypothetical protein